MQEFISEDDLKTFEGWLRYRGVDATTSAPEKLEMWQGLFDEARKRSSTSPTVGLMKLQPVPGEHRYAVAVREGPDLWLALWIRRSRIWESLGWSSILTRRSGLSSVGLPNKTGNEEGKASRKRSTF